MKRVIIIGVIIGLLCLTSVYAQTSTQGGEGGKSSAGQGGKGGDGTVIINNQPKESPKEESKVDVEQIKRLIRDLDADEITVRDKATEELKKIGKPALLLLEESAKSDSPEVAWRSKIIINAIKKAEQKSEPQPDDSASKKIGPTLKQFGNNFNITIRGATPGTKSFAMSQDGSGKITVNITEYDKDGKQNTKTYEANSPEEFKQKYPEIAREYGIGEKPPTTIEIPDFDVDDIFKDFGKSWSRQWGDMQKEMDRLRDMFNRPGNQPPNVSEPEDEGALPSQAPALSATDLGLSIEAIEDSALKEGLETKEGVLVTRVEPLGLGEKAGLKQGDVIINVNNTVVKSAWECRRLLKTVLGKNRVNLTIIRNNKKEALVYPK
ncbi:MAG: PDZ domain-containing protein [Planctomycetes bacterium]|nr:PDZ domain-containing protein [Planctomycetota bacterium]